MVQVIFGAKTQDLEDGVSRAKASIESMTSPTEEAQRGFEGLNDAMKALNATSDKGASSLSGFMKLIGIGAVGGAVAALAEFLHKTGEEMLNLERNSKEAGLSLEHFQELQSVMTSTGMSGDKFVSGLQEASKKLNDLGHGTSELSKFLDANNEKYEMANGMLISTTQYLQMAARLIQNAATEGDKFKAAELLGFSREWVAELEKGPAALRADMEEAKRLGAVLDDVGRNKAAEFEAEWRKSSVEWTNYMKSAALTAMGFLREQIELSKSDWQRFKDDIGTLWDRITGGAPGQAIAKVLGDAGPAATTLAQRFQDFDKHSAALPDYWKDLKTELEGADALMKSIGEGGFVSGKGATIFPEKEDKDALRAALEEMRGAIQLEGIGFAAAQEHAAASLKLFGTTEGQKTAFLLTELQKRQDLELAAVAKASEIDTESEAAKQRVANESLAIEARFVAERQKIIDQAAIAEAASWEAAMKPIQGAWDSQLRGLLAGTTSWAQAEKNIVADLVLDMIKSLETWAAKKAAIALASSIGDPATMITGAVDIIKSMTGPVMAGATAFFAPLLGPAAPAAGAAVAAATDAVAIGLSGGAATGLWNVPGPAPSLWQLHPGEMVVPSSPAERFRQGTGGIGGDGASIEPHFHIHAIDAAGVNAFFNEHAHRITDVLQRHMNLNPSRA